MNLLDVTLRDGGFTCDFNWPLKFAREYYSNASSIVKYVELGYWGQTAKSDGPYYNLNLGRVYAVTKKAGLRNVSIMIDYQYCSKILSDYPKREDQEEVELIRVCARKKDILEAAKFAAELKRETGLKISFNIFNVTNYSIEELIGVEKMLDGHTFDYVYFADTHGNLNLHADNSYMKLFDRIANSCQAKLGVHLHDHLGLALANYLYCKHLSGELVSMSDVSLGGLGKGGGNLRFEDVMALEKEDSTASFFENFILEYPELFAYKRNDLERITAKAGVTDNYATKLKSQIKEGYKPMILFLLFCELCVTGVDKDVFNEDLFSSFFKQKKD